MQLDPSILGKSICDKLRAHVEGAVLVIGSDRFTRTDLAGVKCFNFNAAAILTRIFADIGAKNTKDVFDRIHPRALAVPGLGYISFAVLGAAFERKKLGTLSDYYALHVDEEEMTTFGTFKHHVLEHDKPKRKRA